MSQNNLQLLDNKDGTLSLNYWDSIHGNDVCLEFKDGRWFLENYKDEMRMLFLTECDLIEQLKRILVIQNREENETKI